MQEAKVFEGYEDLASEVRAQREGKTVVCTIGSWDLLHRGHVEYLKKAKKLGDILVVGVDSDIAYQRYKAKPSMFPQEDRVPIIAALGCVDYVTLVHDVDESGQWQFGLVKVLRPDIFLCNYQSFPESQRERLKEFCNKIETVNIHTTEFASRVSVDHIKAAPPLMIKPSLKRFLTDHSDPAKTALVMMKFSKTKVLDQIAEEIRVTLKEKGIEGLRADDKEYHDDLFYNILTYIYGCGFGIAVFERIEADEFNPNVSLEVGYMLALSKPVCLLKDRTLKTLPTDLVGKSYRPFDPQDIASTIPSELSKWLADKGFA